MFFSYLCTQISIITKNNMGKLVINSYDEFAAHLGEELGASE